MNLYIEQQNGGLCRLHSLNAFFQQKKIEECQFKEWIEEFNQFNKKKYNTTISASDFDFFNSDNNCIITYILKYKFNIYTRLYNIGTQNISQYLVKYNNFMFIFNSSHVFGAMPLNGKWYLLDSLNPVPVEVNILEYLQRHNGKIGVIIIVNKKNELIKNLAYVRHDINNKHISDYLTTQQHFIGNIEVPLAIIFEILEIISYDLFKKEIDSYNHFIMISHIDGKFMDIDLKIKYLVPTLTFLYDLEKGLINSLVSKNKLSDVID